MPKFTRKMWYYHGVESTLVDATEVRADGQVMIEFHNGRVFSRHLVPPTVLFESHKDALLKNEQYLVELIERERRSIERWERELSGVRHEINAENEKQYLSEE